MCTGNLKIIYQKDTLTRTLFGSLFQNNYPQPALLCDTSLGAKPGIITKIESIAPDLEVLTNFQGKIIISGREKKSWGTLLSSLRIKIQRMNLFFYTSGLQTLLRYSTRTSPSKYQSK